MCMSSHSSLFAPLLIGCLPQTNFFRSAFAAILVALQEKAIKKLGYGLTFVIFGCICASMIPLVLLELKIGPTFRSRRISKVS